MQFTFSFMDQTRSGQVIAIFEYLVFIELDLLQIL